MADLDCKEETLNWLMAVSDLEERDDFLRKLFGVLPDSGLQKCLNLISRTKRKRRRQEDEARAATEERSAQTSSASLSAPPPLAPTGWLKEWKVDQVIGIDVEKVEVNAPPTSKRKKFIMKSAYITAVNHKKEKLFDVKIKRNYGSYRTTSFSQHINGITDTTLQGPDCEDEELAMQRLKEILRGKLIVGVELLCDFESMGLDIGEFQVFDLQQHYYHLSASIHGKQIIEKIGLKSLAMHYFQVNIQEGEHDCFTDVLYSLRLFLKIYCKIDPPPPWKDYNYEGTNYIEHFKG